MSTTRSIRRTRARRIAATGLAITALLGVSACSDDEADGTTTTTEAAAETPSEGGGEQAAGADGICGAFATLSAAMTGDPSAAAPALDTFEAELTDELREPGTAMIEGFRKMLEGDEAAMGSPEFNEGYAAVGDAMFEDCDVAGRFDISGLDYEFVGLPTEVPAGTVAFRFTNESANSEPHEMIVLQRTPELTESLDEIAHMSPDELMPKAPMMGVVFSDAPGTGSTSFMELEEGSYIAICTIPVGGGEQGDPHAAHGMVAEFEVIGEAS
jgi:hypothetical protein